MHYWNKNPGKAYITAGIGYGKTKLAAFDNAELDANIIATNAVKVTSFVPPNWEIINDKNRLKQLTDKGAFLPMAFAYETSKTKSVSASLAIGVNRDKSGTSIIVEHAEEGVKKEDSMKTSETCLKETFAFRGWEFSRMEKVSVEAEPKKGMYVCALVAVLFFPEE